MEQISSVPSGCGGKTRTCTIQLMRLTSDLRFAPHCVGCFLFRCLLQTQLIREWLNNLTLTGHLTVMYKNCTNILSSAGSGTRTHTVFLPTDFKSVAYFLFRHIPMLFVCPNRQPSFRFAAKELKTMYSLQSVSDVGIAPTYFMGEDISAWNNTKIRHIEIVKTDYLLIFLVILSPNLMFQ